MTASILPLLEKTSYASKEVRAMTDQKKKNFLLKLASLLHQNQAFILSENEKDLAKMAEEDPKRDRLLLNENRIKALADSLLAVSNLPDPANKSIFKKILGNGLVLEKITVPMGVIGVIYESRPNVTIDVTSLSIRSGNAVVLRGGTDAFATNTALLQSIHEALESVGVSTDVVRLLPPDREFVKELLTATTFIDLIIPRGSDALIQFVRQNALVPTIETGAGVCHTYIEKSANLSMAKNIVVNAKTTRPSVCNALDGILVDTSIAKQFLSLLVPDFIMHKIEIFADEDAFEFLKELNYPYLQRAKEEDFGKEFLSYKCSIKVVKNFGYALTHIQKYSSKHSEAIISANEELCAIFQAEVDAAVFYANASTRFTDGEVFDLGAEIGISTQKLHARGPFALEKLVTEKWIVTGNGQIR